jgi:hypothetical protein
MHFLKWQKFRFCLRDWHGKKADFTIYWVPASSSVGKMIGAEACKISKIEFTL